MGKNGSDAENYPKVLKAVLCKDIFLLNCDGKHHREEPPPAAQESPDNNHLYEKDSPTELPTGQGIKDEHGKDTSQANSHRSAQGRIPRLKIAPHVVQVEDVDHDQVKHKGESACSRVAVEYVDKMPQPNQRGKISPQQDQGHVTQDQKQALSSK